MTEAASFLTQVSLTGSGSGSGNENAVVVVNGNPGTFPSRDPATGGHNTAAGAGPGPSFVLVHSAAASASEQQQQLRVYEALLPFAEPDRGGLGWMRAPL